MEKEAVNTTNEVASEAVSEPVTNAEVTEVKSDAQQVWDELMADEAKTEETNTEEDTPVEAVENTQEVETKTEEPAPVEDYKAKYEELNKQLEKYKEAENKSLETHEKEVKSRGFDSIEEEKAHNEVVLFEFKQIANQVSRLNDVDKAQALQALRDYSITQNPDSLIAAKSFLNPLVLEQLALEKNKLQATKNEEINKIKQEKLVNQVKEKLTDFVKVNRDWLEGNQTRIDTVAMIVDTVGVNADLGKVKEMVDKIEAEAIKKYEAKKEADTRKNTLKSPVNANQGISGEKWFTKAEIDKMSDSEYVKNGEKIAKQMLLEKNGELPRRII